MKALGPNALLLLDAIDAFREVEESFGRVLPPLEDMNTSDRNAILDMYFALGGEKVGHA